MNKDEYSGYTRADLIQEINIWRDRAEGQAQEHIAQRCEMVQKMYVDAYKDFKDYKEKSKRYDWIIALLAKFGIKEKTND